MKALLSLIISGALVVSGYSQTRNVLVGTNNAVVQPTNFWSADASNARAGLGLGSAATNPSSAFQPASSVLSNLVSGGALTFSNITVGISNVTGLQSALDGKLGTNPTLAIANISNLQTTLDGKLGTNPTLQISNIAALQTALDGKLSGSFPIAISNVSGLQTALDGKLSTNPTLAISNITDLQTNLDSKLSLTGNAVNLTNFPASLLRTTGDASGLTNFPTLNQNTTGTASNVTGVVAIANGGTGTNSVIGARQNLGLVWAGLTNTNAATFLTGLGATTAGSNLFTLANPSAIRFLRLNVDNTVSTLSDSDFRTAIGLGTAATNSAAAFQPASTVLSNLASGNGVNLTNLQASNVTGTIAISNGGNGATTAGGARTNLGLVLTALTNTNVDLFKSALALGNGDTVTFGELTLRSGTNSSDIQFAVDPVEAAFGVPIVFGFTNQSLNAATSRTNLGLGWSALTNSNSGTGLVSVNTNGEVVSPTNFWQVAPIVTRFVESQPTTNQTTNIPAARNLHIHSLAISTVGVTNTIALPTNNAFNGDVALVVHQGPTSSVTAVRTAGAATNLITLNQFDEAVEFVYYNNVWQFNHSQSFIEPIYFSGTNVSNNIALSRSNLGIGVSQIVEFGELLVGSGGSLLAVDPVEVSIGVPLVFSGTNALANAAASRTNLGLGTTNNVQFNNLLLDGPLNISNGAIYWDTNLVFSPEDATFAVAPNFDDPSATRTNLGLGATWLTNTDVTNFRTAIGLGTTNSVSFFTINVDAYESVGGLIGSNGISFEDGGQNVTRTNLGLPLAALTNTTVTNFQKAIFYTNTAPSNVGGNLGTIAAWIDVVASNGVTYKIPAYTNVP